MPVLSRTEEATPSGSSSAVVLRNSTRKAKIGFRVSMKLLVVEDESKTASYLKKGLAENGFVVDTAGNGDEGLHLARSLGYDLIVLDVMRLRE